MKKVGFLSLVIMVTLLFTLVFPSAAAGPKAPAAIAAAAPMPGHPHIHEALEAMRGARHHMDAAVGDFHGHRAKAIEHLDAAIHEAEICEHE